MTPENRFRIRIPTSTERIFTFEDKAAVFSWLNMSMHRKMHKQKEIFFEHWRPTSTEEDKGWKLICRMWIDSV